MSRSRAWCFTWNNYVAVDVEKCKEIAEKSGTRYLIFGEEVSESGTPHLQGYVWFTREKSMSQMKRLFGDVPHFEKRMGTHGQASEYCKKDGKFWEHGEGPSPGRRGDLERFRDAVKEGKSDAELLDEFPAMYAKYPKFVKTVRDVDADAKEKKKLKVQFEESKLFDWQKGILRKLDEQDDRKVMWVYDLEGNSGKTWLAKYLMIDRTAFLCSGGKKADIALAFNREKYVVFDFPRTMEQYILYDVIEAFKNGFMFSPKYQSRVDVFTPCKVVCFANFMPDKSKLSKDRWDIIRLVGPRGMLVPDGESVEHDDD